MMSRMEVVLEVVGALVCAIGVALVLAFLVDELMGKWIRLTSSMKMFIRFAWMEQGAKLQLQRDMEEEERLRKIPYVPPVDDEDEDEGDP